MKELAKKSLRKRRSSVDEAAGSHVTKIMRALETLARGPCTAAEVTSALGAHPRTVSRLLESLTSEGYVTAYGTGRQRLFSLTLRIVALGQRVISGMDLAEVARPYVRRLSAALNETCHVSVAGQEFVVDLVHETGTRLVAVMQMPGTQVPYHCTAIGKALLAHLPEKQRALLRKPLKRFTERTIVDPEALRAELAKVRARGYAVDELEFSLELRCLAAPVFNYDGDVVCAIGMSAPAIRFTEPNVEAVAAIVVREAAQMSRELGHGDSRTAGEPGIGPQRSVVGLPGGSRR